MKGLQFKKWLYDRLCEASTWRGIIIILAYWGIKLDPELQEIVINMAITLIASVEVIRHDG